MDSLTLEGGDGRCPVTSVTDYQSTSFNIPEEGRFQIRINLLTPNVNYSGRTTPLTSKVAFCIFIQQIYVLNILNMVYTLRFFPLQNAVCFIILKYLVPVLFTFLYRVC